MNLSNKNIRQPGEENFMPVFGGEFDFFLNGTTTNGWLSGGLYIAPPQDGPAPHIHHREDEFFLVIEGRFSFFFDGTWTEGGPGTAVYLPRGKAHTFRNIGDTPGKLYVLTNSDGLKSFFSQCEKPFYRPDGPDFPTIAEIGVAHGIEFVDPATLVPS
ncbi:cupin domain-containing protein [Luteolibacter pohnpeiensis]|uniref:Cupin domain-containing protein n=1 Tax=Luteolibacter pohnpeiensis TaxID=454153 RepID=A0A934VQF0_9BACT|nr:cupin domain-containing protein [Luteolibacter pohnpeiensis]MBK1882036.1 cupin domain-containing protein [Luteolibacter pohnpeiensis]